MIVKTNGSLMDQAEYLQSGMSFNLSDSGPDAKNGTIYYSTSTNWIDDDGLQSQHKSFVSQIFNYLGNITAINFVETDEYYLADIAFSNEVIDEAYAIMEDLGADGFIDWSEIYISDSWQNDAFFDAPDIFSGYVYQTILHEVFHALGLDHLGPYNGTGGYSDSVFFTDSWQNSIMSYILPSENPNVDATDAYIQTLMSVDLLAFDNLYGGQSYNGVNFSTENAFIGDTTYGFNSNLSYDDNPILSYMSSYGESNYYCIVDGAGNDTLDCSGWSVDQLLDLTVTLSSDTAPTTSNIAGLTGNLSLAANTVIENAVGGGGDDVIIGNEYNNYLDGGDGNDQLFGGDGDDIFDWDPSARSGSDTFYGGAGDDLYIIGPYDVDMIVELDGEGDDSVQTFTSYTLTSYVENLTLLGSSDIDGYASNADGISNTLKGNSGNNTLYGYSGDDIFYGGGGADTLKGGSGTDTLKGGGGKDTLNGGKGKDTLNGGKGKDTLEGGKGKDTLNGGKGKDTLEGGKGKDTLDGGKGKDILDGGGGKDTMFGGSSADMFVFTKTSDSNVKASKADIIKDFQQGKDVIDLSAIDASTKLNGNNAFTFDGTTSFGKSNEGDIYFEQFNNAGTANDYTMVYIDNDADRGTEMSIKLMGLHNLTADDFIL